MRRYVGGAVALCAVAGAVLLGAGQAGAQGDRNPSPYQSRTEAFAQASKLEIDGAFKVFVMSGTSERSVVLSGPPELLADVETRVEDGVLTIGFRKGADWSWNPGSGMNVVVNMPVLEGVETHGPAQVEALALQARVPDFAAAVNGAGRITVQKLKADRVQLAVGGSGSVQADGKAGDVAYSVGGAGSIEAKRLRATNGAISVGGPGAVFADISGAANINVGGPGTVEVVGGATCTTRAPRPSQVECR